MVLTSNMVICCIRQTLCTYRIVTVLFNESRKLWGSNGYQILLLSTHCEDWLNKKGNVKTLRFLIILKVIMSLVW